mmetsp:Transcript_84924/g.141582  ORF Transcript_84924/g.141582 Transcript_84924/m.141582 type:complete len:214 (-) Transcript_84924:379-1020(-)
MECRSSALVCSGIRSDPPVQDQESALRRLHSGFWILFDDMPADVALGQPCGAVQEQHPRGTSLARQPWRCLSPRVPALRRHLWLISCRFLGCRRLSLCPLPELCAIHFSMPCGDMEHGHSECAPVDSHRVLAISVITLTQRMVLPDRCHGTLDSPSHPIKLCVGVGNSTTVQVHRHSPTGCGAEPTRSQRWTRCRQCAESRPQKHYGGCDGVH